MAAENGHLILVSKISGTVFKKQRLCEQGHFDTSCHIRVCHQVF